MFGLTAFDISALAWFLIAWAFHAFMVERSALKVRSLNHRMDLARREWMLKMLDRDIRIVDTQIMASLHQGTAFFASTSLFAIGGTLALLRSTDEVMDVFRALPFAVQTTRTVWEVKVVGLLLIFVYAFFKFAWSYRLFNYAVIQLGATPPAEDAAKQEAKDAAERLARMATVAGHHFNRGQRAIFFALAYLGWFINGWVLAAGTAAVLFVILMRQFGPTSRWMFPEP